MTREEKRVYDREWRAKNREKIRENARKYRENNKDKVKESNKRYVEANREKINEYQKKHREANKDRYRERLRKYEQTEKRKAYKKEYSKRYYEEHKEHYNKLCREYHKEHKDEINKRHTEYIKNRLAEDILFKIRHNIRALIRKTIKEKGLKKSAKTEQILGCTVDEFIIYLQSKFQEGMTLENHGEWHIDHIIPISSASTEEEVIKLNHYTNLQPLWAEDNLKKGNKILDTQ